MAGEATGQKVSTPEVWGWEGCFWEKGKKRKKTEEEKKRKKKSLAAEERGFRGRQEERVWFLSEIQGMVKFNLLVVLGLIVVEL
ncbi:hypothetical protein RchiOBHm_Chr3g0497241 [Rosa chinensis]|uniref:Uncharacterized protein n=1 Tax=Rosa chinensis TaxID=74649 RepID=A0A2P6RHN3_ROSCH|nr:hypothetical protein RchiOBHm_Chr3g0497241 [Rosa chinensis]